MTFRLHRWCMPGVFVLLALTRLEHLLSGSFDSVRWNACVHKLNVSVFSHPKELSGVESESVSSLVKSVKP